MRATGVKKSAMHRAAGVFAAVIGVTGILPPIASAGGGPPPEQPTEQPSEPSSAEDHNFVSALDAAGLEYSSPGEAAGAGKVVCRMFNDGYQPDDIVGSLKRLNDDLTTKRAQTFIAISTQHYCPRFTPPEDDEA